jgi:hypothetical protein
MVDSVVDNGIKESVANANMKTVAETSAHSAALAMANAVANQQLMISNAIANQQMEQANAVANAQLEQADAVAHQRRMNILGELNLANAIKGIGEDINEPSVENAVSAQKLLTGNDMAQQMLQFSSTLADQKAEIAALVSVVQQFIKAAQSTPPETATNPIPSTK